MIILHLRHLTHGFAITKNTFAQ